MTDEDLALNDFHSSGMYFVYFVYYYLYHHRVHTIIGMQM